jgi:hypothetical protein
MLCRGLVDPRLGWWSGWLGVLVDKPLRVASVGGGENLGAVGEDLLSSSIVDIDRVQPRDPGVVVLGVVPGEEALAERPGVLDAAESGGEVGPVLQRLKLRLAVR